MAAPFPTDLHDALAANIPRGHAFTFHLVRSVPTACDPLFVPPPGVPPEPTTWESYLLTVSIAHKDAPVHVFALEVLVYYTAQRLRTIFVAKADSTGYLHLAGLPRLEPSAIRRLAAAFLRHLVHQNSGGSHRLVLSLFARAQPQYLFPGSVANTGKHVLDDRQLIRWWCRIVGDVLGGRTTVDATAQSHATAAYLVVPGLDVHETRAYLPRGSSGDATVPWTAAQSPLLSLAPAGATVPPRCMIPRFPDDPKARFALDLDGELPENAIQLDDSAGPPEPSPTGQWRSVRSLAQFWELMAFRQECAAGRVVGFLWAVWNGTEAANKIVNATAADGCQTATSNEATTADKTLDGGNENLPPPTALSNAQVTGHESTTIAENPLSGPAESRGQAEDSDRGATAAPSAAGAPSDIQNSSHATDVAPDTPTQTLLIAADMYGTISALLETLDYATLAEAQSSTRRFHEQAATTAGLSGQAWGVEIQGMLDTDAEKGAASAAPDKAPAPAPMMLVGRKRKKNKPEESAADKVDEAKVPAEKKGRID